jgi:hypothetical protein
MYFIIIISQLMVTFEWWCVRTQQPQRWCPCHTSRSPDSRQIVRRWQCDDNFMRETCKVGVLNSKEEGICILAPT